MSRIGKRILTIPKGIEVTYINNILSINNGKNKLEIKAPTDKFEVKIDDNKFHLTAKNSEKETRMLYGTINALVKNALIGLSDGWKKQLKIVGVGYKAAVSGDKLTLNLGYSKPVIMMIPKDLKVECKIPTEISITGFNKEEVGEFAAVVRSKRPPEPYKGKGIMYVDEIIQRKVGKTAEGSKGK